MGARQRKVGSMQGANFSRQVLEGLLTSSVGFAVFDRWFRYRLVNQALAAMHRVPAPDHAGESLRQITGDAAQKIEPALDAVFATGEGVPSFELIGNVLRRPEAVHWTGTHFPIRDGRGKVKEVGVLVVDVGFEAQNRAANRATKNLLETLILNTHRTQDLVLQLLPRSEPCLTRADSERIIEGAAEAIGKCECRPENGSPVILSHREQEIVCFLANGRSNKEIAATLNISVKTVETHRARLFLKLHLDSFASLVRYAIRNKIVEP
jgi:DNA-binding CsgD family transcriptional regulator